MKRSFALLMAAALFGALLSACAPSAAPSPSAAPAPVPETVQAAPTPAEPVVIRLGGLKGATSMGMVKLLHDAEQGKSQNAYAFTLAGSADELTPKLIRGELDILAGPLNLGAILYHNTQGAVRLAAVNTLGLIYILEKGGERIQRMEDLRGKTIYATGKGSTPEFALTYLLAQHGLDIQKDVRMEWKSEPAETLAVMSGEAQAVAMLPQPYVTVAQGKLSDLRIALDLTREWDALQNGSMLITAGLFVRTDFIKAHPAEFAAFLEEYRASTAFANSEPAQAAQWIEQYDIVKAAVAEKALPYCNIVCITGEEMRAAVQGYLQVLYDQKPEAIGGALPGDDFYYAP